MAKEDQLGRSCSGRSRQRHDEEAEARAYRPSQEDRPDGHLPHRECVPSVRIASHREQKRGEPDEDFPYEDEDPVSGSHGNGWYAALDTRPHEERAIFPQGAAGRPFGRHPIYVRVEAGS